jgi:hypothetical protein
MKKRIIMYEANVPGKKKKKKGRFNLNIRKPGKSDIRMYVLGLNFQTSHICHKTSLNY